MLRQQQQHPSLRHLQTTPGDLAVLAHQTTIFVTKTTTITKANADPVPSEHRQLAQTIPSALTLVQNLKLPD